MNFTKMHLLPLCFAVLVACMAGCEKPPAPVADAGPTVNGNTIAFSPESAQLKNIQTVKVGAPHEYALQIPGRLTWDEDRTVRVFTPFAGRVTRILVDVGQRVAAGQALAELTSPDFGQAQADARKAEADLGIKTAQLNRVKELAAAGVVATKDLQQADADQKSADAEFRRATGRVALFGGNNNVDQRFVLKSPLAGVVVERNINPGQELRPDQATSPQFVVTDPSRLWAQLDASESDITNIRPGANLIITSTQYPDDAFAGELRQVADFVDPVARTLKLRGVVPNDDRRLKAEMFITARLVVPRGEAPVVADKAVFLDGVRRFAFVKTAGGTFVRRGVRVGPSQGDIVPVLAGLSEGEEVVVSGALYLQQLLMEVGTRGEAVEPPATVARKQ